MDVAALIERIRARSARAGADAAPIAAALAQYVDLLARWNRKINLTALAVDPPEDAAIDRLVVEPLVAARWLRAGDRLVMDIGSGGGSPAIPMKIAAPQRRFRLIEVKERKSAFLREVIRQLALADTDVRTDRAENLEVPLPSEAADVITLRAVRLDDAMVDAIRRQLRPNGRLLWFRSAGPEDSGLPRGLRMLVEHHALDGRIAELSPE